MRVRTGHSRVRMNRRADDMDLIRHLVRFDWEWVMRWDSRQWQPNGGPSVGEHPRPITVVLVDDEQLIRTALAQALAANGVDLVGEAADAAEAIEMVGDLRPDVVLMDIKVPGSNGVATIEALSLLAPASRMLILTRTEQNRVVE